MNVEKKEITRVVENEYIITLNEEQALILSMILGTCRDVLPIRNLLVEPLYKALEKNIGYEKVHRFQVDNKNTFESYLWFMLDE